MCRALAKIAIPVAHPNYPHRLPNQAIEDPGRLSPTHLVLCLTRRCAYAAGPCCDLCDSYSNLIHPARWPPPLVTSESAALEGRMLVPNKTVRGGGVPERTTWLRGWAVIYLHGFYFTPHSCTHPGTRTERMLLVSAPTYRSRTAWSKGMFRVRQLGATEFLPLAGCCSLLSVSFSLWARGVARHFSEVV
jgi:hypothetical protein